MYQAKLKGEKCFCIYRISPDEKHLIIPIVTIGYTGTNKRVMDCVVTVEIINDSHRFSKNQRVLFWTHNIYPRSCVKFGKNYFQKTKEFEWVST